MRKIITFFASIQLVCFSSIALCTCPSPIAPLPALPIPAVVPPPTSSCPTPGVTPIAGYLPITIVNNTGLDADEIYVTVLVNSSTQYLSFDTTTSEATISNFTANTYLSSPFITGGVSSPPNYSYQLSSFTQVDSGTYPDNYTFYIPNTGKDGDPSSNFMKSSRILFSLKRPITYFINNSAALSSPSEFDITNDNFYTLNDKVEFDLGSNNLNRLNLNLTWVDFFGIPMSVQADYNFFYGSSYTPYCALTGMPSSVSLNDVYTQYASALSSLSAPFSTYWSTLISEYTNPDSTTSTLRIYAPATAMGSSQTQSNPTAISFPTNYFLNTATSNPDCTWFNKVWYNTSGTAYYQQQVPHSPYLVLDATTTNGSGTATGYETPDRNFTFTISAPKTNVDNGKSVIIPYPTSSKAFFTGAVSDYTPAITGTASSLAFAQVFKVFATSVISGFFPINCQFPTPGFNSGTAILNSSYVQNHASEYFENNSILDTYLSNCPCVGNSPWFDFYSRTLLTIGTPNLFYTSAYSDFLGADGTIVITSLDNHNADATITITLNDCSTGITFPDPYTDSTTYTVYINAPNDKNSNPLATNIGYASSPTGPFTPYTGPFSNTGTNLYIQLTYQDSSIYPTPYNGQIFVTQIAPLTEITSPILPGPATITTNGTTTTVALGAPPQS